LFRCADCQPVAVESEKSSLVATPSGMAGQVNRCNEAVWAIQSNAASISPELSEQFGPFCVIRWRLPIGPGEKKHDTAAGLQHHVPVRTRAVQFKAFLRTRKGNDLGHQSPCSGQ
jgi:hypothetical protein